MSTSNKFQWPTMFSGLRGMHVGRCSQRDLCRHHPGGLDHPPQYRICAGGRVTSGVRPLCGHYSTCDIRPLYQLAPCRGKPGCPHFRDPGSGAYRLCADRRPAAGGICPGPCVDVRPAVLCVLAFSAGISRQFSIPGRAGRLYHRSGDRGVDQPGQKDTWGCSYSRTDRDWRRSPNISMVRWPLPFTPRVILWNSSPCLSPYLMRISTRSRSGWALFLSFV